MQLIRELREWLQPLLEPAADPRVAFGDLAERRQQLLERVREATSASAAARQRLESRIADARSFLSEAACRPPDAASLAGGSAPGSALRDLVATELHVLEEELLALDREQSALPLLERRLDSELDALRVRRQVAAARSSTREVQLRVRRTFDAIAEELAAIARAVDRAERQAGRPNADAPAIDELSTLASTAEPDEGASTAARWLARRFEIEAQDGSMASLREPLEAGRETAELLAMAYARLMPALGRQRSRDPVALASLPALAEESYQRGVEALGAALDLARAANAVGASEPSTLLRRHAWELIEQARRCRAALEQARIELASWSASSSADDVAAVTRSLLAALERARAVQSELRRSGVDGGRGVWDLGRGVPRTHKGDTE